MIYLLIGILGLSVFMKATVFEIVENIAAHIYGMLDKAWNIVFN